MKKIIALLFVVTMLAGCSSSMPSGGESEAAALSVAQCLTEKGAKMYGAFWCPHCSEQKRVFGKKAEAAIPYNECDARGENPVTEECLALKVERYPTWIFGDGSRTVAVLSLSELAEKTGCELPEEEAETTATQ